MLVPVSYDDVWEAVCYTGAYSCEIGPPRIVERDLPEWRRGYYDGIDDIIFINGNDTYTQRKATVFHETLHYLQHFVGGHEIPGPAENVCKLEEEAFRIGDVYSTIIGAEVEGPDWWKEYEYCWEFYAPRKRETLPSDTETVVGEPTIRIY